MARESRKGSRGARHEGGLFFEARKYADGVTTVVTRENSALEYLTYERVCLRGRQTIDLETDDFEAALMVVGGQAEIELAGRVQRLVKNDTVYITRGERYRLLSEGGEVDALLFSAPAENRYESRVIKFTQVERKVAGKDAYKRDVWVCLDPDKIRADRLICGYCHGSPGGWTGWPPHEHGEALEELYVFYDMPENGFAIQMLFDAPNEGRLFRVGSGDAIAIPGGYHPIVASPSCSMKNAWVMAAKNGRESRDMNLARVSPDYAQ